MIRITLLFLATSLTGLNVPASAILAPIARTVLDENKALIDEVCSSSETQDCKSENGEGETEGETAEAEPETERKILEDYFADIPVMVEIAKCESTFRHTNTKTGGILRGVSNRRDVGIMQINELYHLEKALKMNIDIYSIQGNMEFARYLYEKEGTRPWKASRNCWSRVS